VLVALVDEQLAVARGGDQLAGRVEVSLSGEELVCVHAVHLDRDAVGPRADRPFAADRQARLHQYGAGRARTGLRETLRLHHPGGDPGVDEAGRERGHGLVGERGEVGTVLAAAVRRTVLDRGEDATAVQVGCVDRVPGGAPASRERVHAGGQSLDVVEEHDVSHTSTLDGMS
jgi:hypothetical protein